MTELNLLYTDVEDDLRRTVRDLLEDRLDPSAVIAMYDGDRTVVDPLWKAIAQDLGLAGLLIPEAEGGVGASAREAGSAASSGAGACPASRASVTRPSRPAGLFSGAGSCVAGSTGAAATSSSAGAGAPPASAEAALPAPCWRRITPGRGRN